MKQNLKTTLVASALVSMVSLGHSASLTWDGGANDKERFSQAANWNPNKLPVFGDTATVQAGANVAALTGGSLGGASYFIDDVGSSLTSSNSGGTNLQTDINLNGTTNLTLNAGTISWSRMFVLGSTAGLFVNGGTFTQSAGKEFFVQNGGTARVAGGQFNTELFRGAVDATSTFLLSSGSVNVGSLGFNAVNSMEISGGMMTVAAISVWDGQIDFTGLGGSLTVTGYDEADFINEYTQGDLRFFGSNATPFSNNFTVVGDTLTAVPEPGTYAVIGLGLLALAIKRRRMKMQQA